MSRRFERQFGIISKCQAAFKRVVCLISFMQQNDSTEVTGNMPKAANNCR